MSAVVLLLSLVGAASLVSMALRRSGVTVVDQTGAAVVGVGLVGFVVFGALMFGLMRRVGGPLGDVATAADRVGAGDFSVHIQERSAPRFLRPIARAFNAMSGRLKAQDDQRRQLMADVAHELRTPLSVMQGRLEGILDGVYPRDDERIKELLEDARVLGRLVEDLRALANAESGALVLAREPTDLALLASETVRSFRAQAESGQVRLSAVGGAGLPLLEIDPVRIREVLTNVIANALQHTPPGGQVTVAIEARTRDVQVVTTDTGSGIPAEELPKIFDRFSKGPASRGSGLGLAIARRLVAAHGGSMTATSEVGRGTTVTLLLPMVPAGTA
jgi:two-component system OmpR family sensor kinase/two-component system sensor histidine kinase BaeS